MSVYGSGAGAAPRLVVDVTSGKWQPVVESKKLPKVDTTIQSVVLRLDYLNKEHKPLDASELQQHVERLDALKIKAGNHVKRDYATSKNYPIIGWLFAAFEKIALIRVDSKFKAVFDRLALHTKPPAVKAAVSKPIDDAMILTKKQALETIAAAKKSYTESHEHTPLARKIASYAFDRLADAVQSGGDFSHGTLQSLCRKIETTGDLMREVLHSPHALQLSGDISRYFDLLAGDSRAYPEEMSALGKSINELMPEELREKFRNLLNTAAT